MTSHARRLADAGRSRIYARTTGRFATEAQIMEGVTRPAALAAYHRALQDAAASGRVDMRIDDDGMAHYRLVQ